MADGLKFNQLASTTDIDGLLGVAENSNGVTPGNKFTYSKTPNMGTPSNAKILTEAAIVGISPTVDEKAAMDNANNPDGINPFATIQEIKDLLTQDELDAITGANNPSSTNVFATIADIPPAGGNISGTLTSGTIPVATGTNTIADSKVTQDITQDSGHKTVIKVTSPTDDAEFIQLGVSDSFNVSQIYTTTPNLEIWSNANKAGTFNSSLGLDVVGGVSGAALSANTSSANATSISSLLNNDNAYSVHGMSGTNYGTNSSSTFLGVTLDNCAYIQNQDGDTTALQAMLIGNLGSAPIIFGVNDTEKVRINVSDVSFTAKIKASYAAASTMAIIDSNKFLSGTLIYPLTAPESGEILIGNPGGTAYAPQTMSGDATIDSTGKVTVTTPESHLVKVDSVSGSDTTGQLGNITKPFATFNAATSSTVIASTAYNNQYQCHLACGDSTDAHTFRPNINVFSDINYGCRITLSTPSTVSSEFAATDGLVSWLTLRSYTYLSHLTHDFASLGYDVHTFTNVELHGMNLEGGYTHTGRVYEDLTDSTDKVTIYGGQCASLNFTNDTVYIIGTAFNNNITINNTRGFSYFYLENCSNVIKGGGFFININSNGINLTNAFVSIRNTDLNNCIININDPWVQLEIDSSSASGCIINNPGGGTIIYIENTDCITNNSNVDSGTGTLTTALNTLNTRTNLININGGHIVYIDGNRTDTYTADGSSSKPFKTISAAVTAMTGATVGFAINIAPGTYTESGSITMPNVPLTIYGNNAMVTFSSGITFPNPNYTRYDLNTVGNVTFSSTATTGRIMFQGGSLVGNLTLNGNLIDCKSISLLSGVITVNSPAQLLLIACTVTSTITGAGVIFIEDINMNTNKSGYLITSTSGGTLVVANSIITNLGTGGGISCDNGANGTTRTNIIANNFIVTASGVSAATGTAVTIYSKNTVSVAPTGSAFIPVNTDITGAGNIMALGSDAAYDMYYRASSSLLTRIAPNTTTTKKYLSMTGTGSAGAAPVWDTAVSYLETGDISVSTWVCTATNSVPTTTIRLTKINNLVTLYLMAWQATSNAGTDNITAPAGTIPSDYRPDSTLGSAYGFISTMRNGLSPALQTGLVQIGVNGSIEVNMNADGDNFSTVLGQLFGFNNGSISWITSA